MTCVYSLGPATEPGTATALRRSRRWRRCDGDRAAERCTRGVDAGDHYVSVTIFPNHDLLSSSQPYRLAYCLPCAEHYRLVVRES
jgi:hypothetical protein